MRVWSSAWLAAESCHANESVHRGMRFRRQRERPWAAPPVTTQRKHQAAYWSARLFVALPWPTQSHSTMANRRRTCAGTRGSRGACEGRAWLPKNRASPCANTLLAPYSHTGRAAQRYARPSVTFPPEVAALARTRTIDRGPLRNSAYTAVLYL